ncbi:hypothetical protein VTJ04DRAFT_638 [Mycothermus thermophilus]|jgi:hypothetical protein|uniref:uncharacterized protein n=1 Tax=Humicola insolens TaxID=85995 RepID=UPI0037421441
MRFAAAAVAFAGAVLADQTVYSTEYYTITSCPPEIVKCPASATVVTSSVIPLTTSTIYSTTTYTVTDCPDTVSYCPLDSTKVVTETVAVGTTVCPVAEVTETEAPYEPEPSFFPSGSYIPSPPPAETTEAPACPTQSVKTIKTSITTVIPTIIYETVDVPCPTETPSETTPSVPVVTAGAASFGFSAALAAAAGLVALLA